MNAIVASYTSSDSEDEHDLNQVVSKANEQNAREPNLDFKVNQPVLSKQRLPSHTSQVDRDHNIPVSLAYHDFCQHTGDTLNQSKVNVLHGQTTNAVQSQQDSNRTVLHSSGRCLKKGSVMPYIPKAKRAKFADEPKVADTTNDVPKMLSSVLQKPRAFSKENISHYYAPKKRHFRFEAHQECINRICWNPCFQDFILSASMDCVVKVWNVETIAACVLLVKGHTHAVKDAKWNIDGLKVLSGGYDKFSRITDIDTGKEVCANKHNSFVTCVLYHPFDPNVYLTGTSNDGIFAWDIRTQQYVYRYQSFFGQIQDLKFLPDGESFISAAETSRRNSTDKGIMVWDYKTSTILSNQVFQEAYTCSSLNIHPQDNTFLAQCNAGYIAVFSQKSPYKLNKYKRFEGHCVSGYHIGMDTSPDGSLIASGSSDGSIYIYNYRTSHIIKTFALDSQPCMDVAWSPTVPGLLASCDWKGKMFLHK